MSISKDNSNKLFHKPIVKRDEPEVSQMQPLLDLEPVEPKRNEDYDNFIQELLKLSEAYGLVVNDLNKLLSVLIRRTEMQGIALPVRELSQKDSNLSNALQAIYPERPETLAFSRFIQLLKLEKSIISSETASAVNLNEDLKTSLSSISNPVLRAISVIKDSYHKHIVDKDSQELLLADVIVDAIAKNQSSQSALSFIPENYALDQKLLNDNSPEAEAKKKSNKSKLTEWVEECIPCGERYYGLMDSFQKSKPLEMFYSLYLQNLLGELSRLLQLKLAIANPQLMNSLCSMINYIGDFMCLPDIVAVISLFKLTLSRLKGMFKEVTLSLTLPQEWINVFIQPAMDALFSTLIKLLSSAFSPLYCLIDSLQVQASKFGYYDEAGYEKAARSKEEELHSLLVQGMQSVESWVSGILKEIQATLTYSKHQTITMTDILAQIDQYTQWLGLFMEILAFYKNLNSSYPVKLSKVQMKTLLQKSARSICAAAYSNKLWLSVLDDLREEISDLDDSQDDKGDSGSGNDDKKSDEDNPLVIVDDSLGDDFYDEDALDLFDDDYWKEKFGSLEEATSLAQGEISFKPDQNKLDNYKSAKERTLKIKSRISKTGESSQGVPSIVINFQSCIDKFNLSGDPVLVNQWISKIVNG